MVKGQGAKLIEGGKFIKIKGRKKIPTSKAFWRMTWTQRELARRNNFAKEFMPKERRKKRRK